MQATGCLKIVGAFSNEEIADLERRAAEVAGNDSPGNHHYMVAVERLLAELKGEDTAKAPRSRPEPTQSETEAADIQDIERALVEYNKTADERTALEHLQWVYDESQENSSPQVREYAARRLAEEAAPSDMEKLTLEPQEVLREEAASTSFIRNPDNETNRITPEVMSQLVDGPSALRWLMTSATDPWHRTIARRIARGLVNNVSVRFVREGDTVPSIVARRLSGDAAAVAWMRKDGTYELYFHAGKALNETTILHELIHAATMRALEAADNAKLAGEVEELRKSIAASLRALENAPGLDTASQDIAAFFSRVVNDAHELLAYGFSSPTLREWMGNMTADGVFMRDSDRPDALRKDTERFIAEPAPLTLWQKFTDLVRRLLGLPAVNQARFDQMLRDREALVAGIVQSRTPRPLYSRLDELLEKVLDAGTAAPAAEAVTPSTERVARDDTEPPAPAATSKARRLAREVAGGWQNAPGVLGWLSNRQLTDRFSDIPAMRKLTDLIGQMSAKSKSLLQEAHHIDHEWAQLPQAEALEMQRLMLESTLDRMHIDRAFDHPTNAHLNSAAAERHAALAARYAKLGSRAKAVFQRTEAKFRSDWLERATLLRSRIVDQYRPELRSVLGDAGLDAAARLVGAGRNTFMADKKLSRAATKALRSLWSDIDDHRQAIGKVRGPYFPLVRFGQHVVVSKSPTFLKAQEAYKAAAAKYEQVNADDEATPDDIAAARDALAKTREAVSNLKDSARDYIVEFYEKRSEADDRVKQLQDYYTSKDLKDMEVRRELREQHFAQLDSVSPAFMNKLEETLRAGLPDKDAADIRAAVRDLYIQSMPERSALKAQLNRMNVRGAKAVEMRRAFAASTMRNAWHLSRLQFNLPMHQALTELRSGASDKEKLVGAEMAKRFVQSMTFTEDNPLVTALSQLGYFSYLGLSPSFLVLNMAQPWVISVPVMAGRFGIGAPTREMGRAFSEVAAALKASAREQKTWRFELDLDKFKDAGERRMLEQLFDKGIIDITIEHDLGAVASGDAQTAFSKAMQLSALPAHHTEVFNRVMTALAAYRLEKQNAARRNLDAPAAERAAVDYAEKIVAETHLDYSPENSPRLMRGQSLGGLGRLVWQFKKYSQGMIYLVAKNLVDATRGDKEARRVAAYLMGSMLAVAGSSGLPVAMPIGLMLKAIAQLWDDDDEPEIATMLYNGLKNALGEPAARALVKGLPAAAGVDLSGRLGMGSLLDPFGVARDSTKQGKDWVAEKVLALAGPAPSLVANYAEALAMAATDPVRAATTAMPKFMADPLRAMDRANRGITTRGGDTLVAPEELGLPSVLVRALGFETTSTSDMYENRAAFNEMRQNKADTRKALIADFVRARLEGSDVADARSEVAAFNARHPSDRISPGQLEQAVQRQRRDNREMKNGVRATKRDADVVEKLGE